MQRATPQSAEPNDAQLLQRVALQDRQAFEELYHGYYRRLSRFLRRMAPRQDFAEEVINDTFWVVWRSAAGFRGSSRVSTWILGIAYRQALRALRDRRSVVGNAAEALPVEAADGDDAGDARDNEEWIARGLQTLPVEQRLTIELAYFMGHSCEEIAVITACPVGTVKARMFHARERLRAVLPALGGGWPDHTS